MNPLARWLSRLGVAVRYLVHMRVPITGALALIVGPHLLRSSSLTANLFELGNSQLMWLGAAAGLAGWACVATALVVLRLAPLRFRLPTSARLATPGGSTRKHRLREYASALLLSLGGLLFAGCGDYHDPEPWRALQALSASGGACFALLLVWFVENRTARLARPSEVPPPAAPGEMHLLDGYLAPGPARWFRRILPGHLPAFCGLVVLLAGYALITWTGPQQCPLPVLGMLLFAVAVAVTLGSGATFFFDRFGLPLVLLVLTWSAIAGTISGSTHYFLTTPHGTNEQPLEVQRATAAAAFSARGAPRPRALVVCAEGGGIQAAAWTAEVLVGLDQALGEDFARHLQLVSAVSGGSVGAMHYLSHFQPRQALTAVVRDEVRKHARFSSLQDVGWALFFKDLRRPFGVWVDETMDRSIALEQAWQRQLAAPQSSLADWASKTAAGELPAVVFNATLAGVGQRPNKGQRLAFSTIDFPGTRLKSLHSFFDHYPRRNIGIVTAVRMSATFPYVTPLARAGELVDGNVRATGPSDYVADGGYFDNSGIATAMDWVSLMLEQKPELEIAILLIRAFPAAVTGHEHTSPKQSVSAWLNALAGPLDLALATRSTTQTDRADLEAHLVRQLTRGRVASFVFQFEVQDEKLTPPLSWHLSTKQAAAIDQAWHQRPSQSGEPVPAAQAEELKRWLSR